MTAFQTDEVSSTAQASAGRGSPSAYIFTWLKHSSGSTPAVLVARKPARRPSAADKATKR